MTTSKMSGRTPRLNRAWQVTLLLLLVVAALGALAAAPRWTGSAAPAPAAVSPYDLRPVDVRGWVQAQEAPAEASPRTLYLPAGFDASVFARPPLPRVRSLAMGPDGTLFAAVPRHGVVLAFPDRNRDGQADRVERVVDGLSCPYGMAFETRGGATWLYVAQTRQVTRFPLTAGGPAPVAGPAEVVVHDLPQADCRPHGYRPLAIAPAADALYVAVGSTCNVCLEEGPGAGQFAKVWRYPLAAPGPGVEVARGLRNVAALALNPWDGALWGVNAERDDRGDDVPPEMITAIQAGADYGWPFCYQGADGRWQPDGAVPPANPDCAGLTAPTIAYQAHSAPLGLAFHDGRGLPPTFGRSLFVALHGSWDHEGGVGYKVLRVPLDAQGRVAGEPHDFALGWLTAPRPRGSWDHVPEAVWGRPVDVAVGPDGALYVSDDHSGLIYRLAFTAAPDG